MEVLKVHDKKLRQVSEDISYFDDFLQLFVNQMIETMYEHDAIGLAAPQVGVNRNVIVVDPSMGEDKTAIKIMINPKITERSGTIETEEGCLSIPGFKGIVPRSEHIEVEFSDILGVSQKIKVSGILSIIIQHEIDHLHGILFVDKANSVKMVQKTKILRREEKIA